LHGVSAQLLTGLRQMAPLLWSNRNPFDAAARGKQRDGDQDQSDADGDGPPVLPVVGASQWSDGRYGYVGGNGDVGHGGSWCRSFGR
jgi:hypothetical protein